MRLAYNLQFRLLTLVILVALPMLMFVFSSYAQLRAKEAAEARMSALATAREVALHERSQIEQTCAFAHLWPD